MQCETVGNRPLCRRGPHWWTTCMRRNRRKPHAVRSNILASRRVSWRVAQLVFPAFFHSEMTDVSHAVTSGPPPRPFYASSAAADCTTTSINRGRQLAAWLPSTDWPQQKTSDGQSRRRCMDGARSSGLDGWTADRGLGWIMSTRLHTPMTLIHAVHLTSRHWHVLPSQWITAGVCPVSHQPPAL